MSNFAQASFSGDVWLRDAGSTPKSPWVRISQTACVIFLLAQLFGGVLRWLLDFAGLSAATYLPNVFMLGCVGFMLVADAVNQRTSRSLMVLVVVVLLSMVVGYLNTGKAVQVIFGAWVLMPFFFGLTFAPVLLRHDRYTRRVLAILFLISISGVILESFVALPWVGLSYSLGGVDIEGAREWQTSGGTARLSGFARASFDVAGQILIYAALLVLQIRQGVLRILVWILAIAAISLSTSKGTLLSLVMTGVAVEAAIYRKPQIFYGVLTLGIFWMFVPPLMSWTLDWTIAARTDLNHPLYGSFIDRMNDMWPRAGELAFEHGLPPLGRGLGGIGVPVSMFEPKLENAGDNLFVYCMVMLGIVSLPVFALGFVGLFKLCAQLRQEAARQALVIAVAVNWYGGVSNILEHAVLAFGFGMICRVVAAQLAGCTFGKAEPEPSSPSSPSLRSLPSSPIGTPSLIPTPINKTDRQTDV